MKILNPTFSDSSSGHIGKLVCGRKAQLAWGSVLSHAQHYKLMLVAMKKITLGVFALAILPQFAFASFDTNLRYGSTGSSVSELQEFLTDQGVYNGPVTGSFYSLTLRAVKKFQTNHAITPVSGFWGPLTRTTAQAILDDQLKNSNLESSTTNSAPQAPTPSAQSQTIPTPAAPQTTPVPQYVPPVTIAPTPVSQARIDVVNYSTDLTRQYTAMPTGCKLIIGSNYNDVDCSPSSYPTNGDVTLKAILYNDDGSVNQSAVMQITATDSRQNKTFNGTGNIVTFYKDAQKQQVYGYVFGYHFLAPGEHIITFSAQGLSKSVTIMAN